MSWEHGCGQQGPALNSDRNQVQSAASSTHTATAANPASRVRAQRAECERSEPSASACSDQVQALDSAAVVAACVGTGLLRVDRRAPATSANDSAMANGVECTQPLGARHLGPLCAPFEHDTRRAPAHTQRPQRSPERSELNNTQRPQRRPGRGKLGAGSDHAQSAASSTHTATATKSRAQRVQRTQ